MIIMLHCYINCKNFPEEFDNAIKIMQKTPVKPNRILSPICRFFLFGEGSITAFFSDINLCAIVVEVPSWESLTETVSSLFWQKVIKSFFASMCTAVNNVITKNEILKIVFFMNRKYWLLFICVYGISQNVICFFTENCKNESAEWLQSVH